MTTTNQLRNFNQRSLTLNKERKHIVLFEVAILEKPTKKEIDDEGKTERLAFGPKAVVANDAQSAAIAAVLDGEKINVDRSRMTVLVRPFA